MKTMVIDTASSAASVAVTDGGLVLGEFFIQTERTHSQHLMPMAAALLKTLDLSPADLEAVAVCVGPGSFTGVRIGISTAKGFAQPFNLPIYPFTSTRLLTAGVNGFTGIVVAVIDAKRGNAYYGIYSRTQGLTETLSEGIMPLKALVEDVQKRFEGSAVCWVGDAAGALDPALFDRAPEHLKAARASNFVDIKEAASVHYDAVDAHYIQKSQAEQNRHD